MIKFLLQMQAFVPLSAWDLYYTHFQILHRLVVQQKDCSQGVCQGTLNNLLHLQCASFRPAFYERFSINM